MEFDSHSSSAQQRLRAVEHFDLSVVIAKFASEQNVSLDHAEAVCRETIRYLVLCVANSKPYGIGGEIDKFWHTFILFTQRYAHFCDRVAGRFIHHTPLEDLPPSAAKLSVSAIDDYRIAYGVEPDRTIWQSQGVKDSCREGPCVHDCTPLEVVSMTFGQDFDKRNGEQSNRRLAN